MHLHIYDVFTFPRERVRARVRAPRASVAIMSPSESVAGAGVELKSAAIKIVSCAMYPRRLQVLPGAEREREKETEEGGRERERRALRLRNRAAYLSVGAYATAKNYAMLQQKVCVRNCEDALRARERS